MNRVAVVTGAARGIGAATVRRLAADGWAVVAVDRASDDVRLPYAMGTAAELHAVVASAAAGGDAGGGPRGRHHRRGRPWPGRWRWPRTGSAASTPWWPWPGSSPAGCPCGRCRPIELGAVLGVDLGGPITAARVGIPALLRRPAPRQGRFLAVASAAATRGLPMLAAYGAAKAGVAGLVRGLAVELADTGVTANAVSPGSTETAILRRECPPLRPRGHPVVRRPAAGQAAAAPRRGGRRPGLAGRSRQQRHDRRRDPRGRRPLAVTPLPEGFGIELDRSVRRFGRGIGAGRRPSRPAGDPQPGRRAGPRRPCSPAPRPPPAGAGSVPAWWRRAWPIPGRRSGRRPPPPGRDLTVVVPARDRLPDLDRCLASLVPGPPVVVVDDGSEDPGAVAEVCRRHGARLVLRPFNGGPGAARNDGARRHRTPTWSPSWTATARSPRGGWSPWSPCSRTRLSAPWPRGSGAIRLAPGAPVPAIDRYSDARSPLDMGPDPSEVGPDRLVRYVPTAALVVRTAALADGFDPDLRVGEDVDLVWRMLVAGWRVRYEPSVTVHHREPARWGGLLAPPVPLRDVGRTAGPPPPRRPRPRRAATVAHRGGGGRPGRTSPGRRRHPDGIDAGHAPGPRLRAASPSPSPCVGAWSERAGR